jgi:hypothetical protein
MLRSPKDKICECGKAFVQYNSLKKYCSWDCEKKHKTHSQNLTKKKPIPKVSEKQKKLNLEYSKLRKEFLSLPENQICPVTKQQTTDVHHTFCGKDRQKYFLDTSTWLAVSREGHIWIHDNPKESREIGYLK